jgi:hypothetical protein
MNIVRDGWKLALLASVAAGLCVAAARGADKAKDQAKLYEQELQALMGKKLNDISGKLREWSFETLQAWEANDPTAKEVGKHNRGKVKFSKKDYAEIFGPGGAFKVAVWTKKIGSDATTMGEIDGGGLGVGKDTKIVLETFAVIRVVFKDDALVKFRVWPKLEQSGFAGGTFYRRH